MGNTGDIADIMKEVNSLLNSKITKSAGQGLRDFRKHTLKDKDMEKNSYEYIRSINWYQNEINNKLIKIYTGNNVKENTKELIKLLGTLDCRIEQFLRHRELWHKDSTDFEYILRDSYYKILDKCKEVVDLPDFLDK